MLLKGRNVLYSLSKHDSYGNARADCFLLVDLKCFRKDSFFFFPFIRVSYCNVKNNMILSVILILYNRVTNILDTIFPFTLPMKTDPKHYHFEPPSNTLVVVRMNQCFWTNLFELLKYSLMKATTCLIPEWISMLWISRVNNSMVHP